MSILMDHMTNPYPTPEELQQLENGWVCPVCQCIMAPCMLTCVRCIGKFGIKPGYVLPEEIGFQD